MGATQPKVTTYVDFPLTTWDRQKVSVLNTRPLYRLVALVFLPCFCRRGTVPALPEISAPGQGVPWELRTSLPLQVTLLSAQGPEGTPILRLSVRHHCWLFSGAWTTWPSLRPLPGLPGSHPRSAIGGQTAPGLHSHWSLSPLEERGRWRLGQSPHPCICTVRSHGQLCPEVHSSGLGMAPPYSVPMAGGSWASRSAPLGHCFFSCNARVKESS